MATADVWRCQHPQHYALIFRTEQGAGQHEHIHHDGAQTCWMQTVELDPVVEDVRRRQTEMDRILYGRMS